VNESSLHGTYPRAEGMTSFGRVFGINRVHIYKMFENTIWLRGGSFDSSDKNDRYPLKWTVTVNVDSEVVGREIHNIHPAKYEYRIWGTRDWAIMSALGKPSDYKNTIGYFFYKNVQFTLFFTQNGSTLRLFIHTDLGADNTPTPAIAMVERSPAGSDVQFGNFAGDSKNIFKNSRVVTGKRKLYIIIGDKDANNRPVVLTLDWQNWENSLRHKKCPPTYVWAWWNRP
jgi:hypothetical protein